MSYPPHYAEYWKDWRPRTPPLDPCGPQHSQPDPEFAALCQDAERVGAWVELDASAVTFSTRPDSDDDSYRYRNIVALRVRHPDRDAARVTIRAQHGDTFRSMAERARIDLERQL